MLSAFAPWCADECISAFESQSKKPHQGVAPQNLAQHQGITWSNSTVALGLRSLAVETRVRSRCTGKERDSESGLDMFGARYYGSSLGRFMTPDWAAKPTAVPYAYFGDPQSLNLYSYVGNNPLKRADPDGHCPSDNPNCGKMQPNPVANVNSEVKQAVNNSVKASDKPTADDTKGKSHEEGGTAWTKNGTQTVAPAVPGAYKDVKQPGVVEIDPNKAANPAQQKPGDVQADVVWHVHPGAQVTETTGSQSAPGTVVFGGSVTTTTYNFVQPPSAVDMGSAGPAPTLNLVIGARDKTVYVFGSSGVTCQESLKDFNK
jgi:RHS repeat-associated protein